jgi:hypothetical protein
LFIVRCQDVIAVDSARLQLWLVAPAPADALLTARRQLRSIQQLSFLLGIWQKKKKKRGGEVGPPNASRDEGNVLMDSVRGVPLAFATLFSVPVIEKLFLLAASASECTVEAWGVDAPHAEGRKTGEKLRYAARRLLAKLNNFRQQRDERSEQDVNSGGRSKEDALLAGDRARAAEAAFKKVDEGTISREEYEIIIAKIAAPDGELGERWEKKKTSATIEEIHQEEGTGVPTPHPAQDTGMGVFQGLLQAPSSGAHQQQQQQQQQEQEQQQQQQQQSSLAETQEDELKYSPAPAPPSITVAQEEQKQEQEGTKGANDGAAAGAGGNKLSATAQLGDDTDVSAQGDEHVDEAQSAGHDVGEGAPKGTEQIAGQSCVTISEQAVQHGANQGAEHGAEDFAAQSMNDASVMSTDMEDSDGKISSGGPSESESAALSKPSQGVGSVAPDGTAVAPVAPSAPEQAITAQLGQLAEQNAVLMETVRTGC